MKLFTLLLVAGLALAGCSMPKPPTVNGDSRSPVNDARSLASIEARAQALNEREARIAQERAEALAGKRPALPTSYTVSVEFATGSSTVAIDTGEAQKMREYLGAAKRVEVRGRTDGIGRDAANSRLAHDRAQAVKDWLVYAGYPATSINVSYRATGDYIASRDREPGRGENRRVEVEFFN